MAIAVCIASCAALVLWYHVLLPAQLHQKAYRQVEVALLKLSTKRPADVSKGQWVGCLMHTWNLHTNFGPFLELHDLEALASELDEAVDGPVTLETIDWIWNQFLQRSHGGSTRYDTAYRPTKMIDLGYDGSELRWWLERYEEATTSKD